MDRVRQMQIEFTSPQITRCFSVVIVLLVIAHIGYMFMRYGLGYDMLMGFGPLVDMWREHNLPNFYSSMALLFCALLLYLISLSERRSGGRFGLHWLGLAAAFVFVSVDEMVMIHELTVRPLRTLLGTSGVFYFAWVIPYGLAMVVLSIIYLRFFLGLTLRTRTLMVIAAAVYIGAAIGFEMISSFEYEKMTIAAGHENIEDRTFLMDVYNLIEEVLEMVGVLIFMRALTDELARRQVQVGFSSALIQQSHPVSPGNS